MTRRQKLAVLPGALLLGACSVKLDVAQAVATPVPDTEVKQWAVTAPGPGRWFDISAALPRRTVRRIARWEILTHMSIEDCRTGAVAGSTWAVAFANMDARPSGYFERIREELPAHPQQQFFWVEGTTFLPEGALREPLCVRLEGGGPLRHPVVSTGIRLRFAAPRHPVPPSAAES